MIRKTRAHAVMLSLVLLSCAGACGGPGSATPGLASPIQPPANRWLSGQVEESTPPILSTTLEQR